MTEPWVSAEVIAEHLGVTKGDIYGWITRKVMPAHGTGWLRKFQETEVDGWVRRSGADETSDSEVGQ